jgi:hypothetical protein
MNEGGYVLMDKNIIGSRRYSQRSLVFFDFVNKNNQVKQERLYSEERKRGIRLKIMKEVACWKETIEKLRQQRKATNTPKPIPGFLGKGWEAPS